MRLTLTACLLAFTSLLPIAALAEPPHVFEAEGARIRMSVLGHYQSGIYRQSAAEIVTHDPATQRGFVINAASGEVDVLDLSNPANPTLLFTIDVSDLGADANSVAVKNGVVAVAVEASDRADNGFVALYDTDGTRFSVVEVGALPDALTFSPNGRWVLVANEGEPVEDYARDPEGSVSIIDLAPGAANVTQANVRTADFRAFNGREDELRAQGIRIFGPGASAAQDFEPEWVEVSADNRTAYVSLQENNAIGVIDIETATVTAIHPLGFKDWSENGEWAGNGFDASRQGEVNIRHWPVFGIYHPDTIRIFETNGETYILTANEGDARDYEEDEWWSEEFALGRLRLDPVAFPNAAELQASDQLGQLLVTSTMGVANACNPSLTTAEAVAAGYANVRAYVEAECVYNQIYTFGARSFGVYRVTDDGLELVWDSGSQMEETVLATTPDFFNADHRDREVQLKRRSPNKGPEPEGIAVGTIGDRTYAFVGLERVGGIMVYDITVPEETTFVKYINNRDFSVATTAEGATATDLGAEGLHFISAADSPDPQGRPLLMVGHEVSGTTTLFAIDELN
ncbi:choice-of-anchor I family protein [Leptolyngbya sp. KIOST-1]|uniref:choice-of-anchor I family protein n=1 Tax=Leptolyngbya sp. KIOST-1 TaxID=1229172 RepID=UPI00068E262A|nr:choice-of-anchor I family protein [Leptolyngbya sp. KIOST-1]